MSFTLLYGESGFTIRISGPRSISTTDNPIRRAVIAKQELQVFKPSIDDRYSVLHVSSHSGQNIEAVAITKPREIFKHLSATTTVVAVDEVQFFDTEIVGIVQQLAARGMKLEAMAD